MLRSATNAPELYKSSGGLKIPLQRLRLLLGSAPLRGAKILKAALQPELKMPYAPLPERSGSGALRNTALKCRLNPGGVHLRSDHWVLFSGFFL